jgi:hypothetical protein
MLTKLKTYCLLFLGVMLLTSYSKKAYVKEYLAFNFNPGPNMEVMTYAIVTTQGGRIVKSVFINRTSFINRVHRKRTLKGKSLPN